MTCICGTIKNSVLGCPECSKATLEKLAMEGFIDPHWNMMRESLETMVKASVQALLSHTGASGLTLTLPDGRVINVKKPERKIEWENVSPGEYDDTMRCTRCGFEYTHSADAPSEENVRRSKHDCRRVAR